MQAQTLIELEEKWLKALLNRDEESLLRLYSDRSVVKFPFSQEFITQEAKLKHFIHESEFLKNLKNIDILRREGPLVFEDVTLDMGQLNLTDNSGKPHLMDYTVVFSHYSKKIIAHQLSFSEVSDN